MSIYGINYILNENSMLMDIVAQVMAVYAEMDQQVVAFQLKSGLRCLAGCGRCCPQAPVEATVLEMLPAANEILLRGQGDVWLENLRGKENSADCVFYSDYPDPGSQGHCTFYNWRPTVCRLFGFAAVRTRHKQKKLSVCKYLKPGHPAEVAAAMVLQAEAPCFSDAASRVYSIKPDLGANLMPINAALRNAILHLGLRMQLGQSEALGTVTAA